MFYRLIAKSVEVPDYATRCAASYFESRQEGRRCVAFDEDSIPAEDILAAEAQYYRSAYSGVSSSYANGAPFLSRRAREGYHKVYTAMSGASGATQDYYLPDGIDIQVNHTTTAEGAVVNEPPGAFYHINYVDNAQTHHIYLSYEGFYPGVGVRERPVNTYYSRDIIRPAEVDLSGHTEIAQVKAFRVFGRPELDKYLLSPTDHTLGDMVDSKVLESCFAIKDDHENWHLSNIDLNVSYSRCVLTLEGPFTNSFPLDEAGAYVSYNHPRELTKTYTGNLLMSVEFSNNNGDNKFLCLYLEKGFVLTPKNGIQSEEKWDKYKDIVPAGQATPISNLQ